MCSRERERERRREEKERGRHGDMIWKKRHNTHSLPPPPAFLESQQRSQVPILSSDLVLLPTQAE